MQAGLVTTRLLGGFRSGWGRVVPLLEMLLLNRHIRLPYVGIRRSLAPPWPRSASAQTVSSLSGCETGSWTTRRRPGRETDETECRPLTALAHFNQIRPCPHREPRAATAHVGQVAARRRPVCPAR